MTYPSFDTSGLIDATDIFNGPVTCSACGCRLQHSAANGIEAWFHFAPMGGKDARGDLIACADAPHDARGRALVAAAA